MSSRRNSPVGRLAVCALLASLTAVPGLALASPRARATGKATYVGTRRNGKLGVVLVDSRGHTLYLSTDDGRGRSNCLAACARVWTPLRADGRAVARRGSGLNQRWLGEIRRRDGELQVTYDHHPLYLYSKDRRAGDMHGEGARQFSGTWYVLNTRAAAVKPKQTSTSGLPCDPLCTGY